MKNILIALPDSSGVRAASLLSAISRWPAPMLTAFALSACVTTPVLLPADTAEQAADKIIKEIWQISQNTPVAANQPCAKDDK